MIKLYEVPGQTLLGKKVFIEADDDNGEENNLTLARLCASLLDNLWDSFLNSVPSDWMPRR